jgi:hypothetical protein
MKPLPRRTVLAWTALSVLPWARPAAAKKRKKAEPDEPEPEDHRPGVTFAGFRMLSGGKCQIWVHVTGEPSITSKHSDGAEVYTLHDAKLLVRNNQNPLITEFFQTAVLSANLKRSGRDVELRVKLRKGTGKSQHRIRKLKAGAVSVQIEFPKAPPQQPSPTPQPGPEPKPAPSQPPESRE